VTGILIIMNNYFHDVATAVLLGSAIIMWVMGRQAERTPGDSAVLARFYPTLTKFAWGAVAWIVVGGIPRTIFFTRYEWDPAVVKGIVPALIVKHSLMAIAVVAGVLLWRSVKKRIEQAGR